ncbi:hypothetical protein [Bacteroides acidifaciens]|uniref:hypothetical protein n=1 Tax=Bacteroides acidifaciens TaxID=85831 RepID=UPI00262EB9C5|nr:hypothetical protein [Bacteroides acidifaciens]
MSHTYETRLKKEFELLQRLERHPNVKGIITLYYKDRVEGGAYKSILETPTSGLYPNEFKVTYKMPMYVAENQLKRDWQASFLFEVPEEILMDPNSKLGVEIEGNNGNFPEGSKPFNNHVSTGWVCTGTAWGVANQGFGIWYFIIAVGCLLNQEKFMMASEDADENRHLNADAFRFWKNVRKMQPNNKIDWPFKLMDDPVFGEPQKKKFSFGEKKSTQPSFSFGQVKHEPQVTNKFTFGQKK